MMKFDDKKYIAKIIKRYRKKYNFTQEQLAEKVDLSVQHVSRIENGCYIPSLKTFFLLAEILNIDLKEFGYDIKRHSNKIKDNLLIEITNATDSELILYENIIKSVKESIKKINNNYHI